MNYDESSQSLGDVLNLTSHALSNPSCDVLFLHLLELLRVLFYSCILSATGMNRLHKVFYVLSKTTHALAY